MHDQRTLTPAEEDAQIESAILGSLLDPHEQRPWSVEEVAREIGNPVAVHDSLRQLQGVGLIHRCGEFVWATRAALAAHKLRP